MKRVVSIGSLVAVLGALAWLIVPLRADITKPANETELEQKLKRASVNGKYRMLLAQFKADYEGPDEFKGLGIQSRTEYAGHKDLPKGHWVYVKPYWYIWRDLST